MIKDNTLLVNTFIPMLTSPRSPLYSNLPASERRKLVEDTRQLYLSSIRSEADWSWGKFLDYLKYVTDGDRHYGILSLPYQLGVRGGYILKSNVELQFRENPDKVDWLKAETVTPPVFLKSIEKIFNCWKPLKLSKLKHKALNWFRCECYESRKNWTNGIRLNPKCLYNRQSATKLEREGSTTISKESRPQVFGGRNGIVLLMQ